MSANTATRRSVVLKRRPRGEPGAVRLRNPGRATIPTPGPGEVVTRTIWLSIDPYMRGRLREEQTYAVAIQIGEVMTGETVGEVIASDHPDFAVGDIAVGARGWQTHNISKGDHLVKIDRHAAPLSAYLGVLGMPGATAYAGITEICKPKQGETVVVSAASGAVGSVAGQLAKRAGARVVGIAGGPEKCLWVQDSLGFDACVDHRSHDLRAELLAECPDGIDAYFENVGGERAGSGVRAAQSVRPRGDVRDGLAVQRTGIPARSQPWVRRRQARADPGLHRVRPAGAADRMAHARRAVGRRWRADLSRGCA